MEPQIEFSIGLDWRNNGEGQFLVALSEALSEGWTDAPDVEAQAAPSCRFFLVCYRCDERGQRPAASLALWREVDGFAMTRVNPEGWERREMSDLPPEKERLVKADFLRNCLEKIDPETTQRLSLRFPPSH